MNIIEIIKVIILGIVEGFTEWLPISSTGHMLLVDDILHLNVSPEFKTMFMVVIQLGAILAVVVMFFGKLNPFSPKKSSQQRKETWIMWSKIIIACLPAAIIGLAFDDWLDEHLYKTPVIAATLIIYGILFIVIEKRHQNVEPRIKKVEDIDYVTAFSIGAFQVLSLIPGTSRSGSTILGGIILGASRTLASEFSFFLGIPTMFGASFLKLVKFGFHYSAQEVVYLLLGMIVAFVVSVYVIRLLLNWVKKHDFTFFGYDRIVLGVIVLVWSAVRSILLA